MEVLIAIVVIVALSELREYRFHKATQKILEALATEHAHVQHLVSGTKTLCEAVEIISATQKENEAALAMLTESLSQIKETLEKTEANSAAVLREYELNGVPLGMMRKQPDFIEGL